MSGKPPNLGTCGFCKSRQERYRTDYPATDPRAYRLVHAKGCPRPFDIVKPFSLPPRAFSNAINIIYKDFHFQDWEKSPEWRLFNAGMEAAYRNIGDVAATAACEAAKVVRT